MGGGLGIPLTAILPLPRFRVRQVVTSCNVWAKFSSTTIATAPAIAWVGAGTARDSSALPTEGVVAVVIE